MCRMVLEWTDREHGDVEEAIQGDLMAQQALRACGLYKFFVSWQPEGQTKTLADASGLMGSRLRVFSH